MISEILIVPWETIDAEIKARNLSQKEVAKRLWVSEKHLIDLIKGEVSITREMALKLEYVFWVSANFWLNLDKAYQEQKILLEDKNQLKKEENLISNYVTSKNKKVLFNFIEKSNDKLVLVKQIKKFFAVTEINTIDKIYNNYFENSINSAFFRKNDKFELNKESMNIFLRIWELEADSQEVAEFDRTKRDELMSDLKPYLKAWQPDIDGIKTTLNKYWIFFSFLKLELEKLPVKWFVRYYADQPLIQITNKWKKADIFRFNLYHELWHIYKHLKKKSVFLDFDWQNIEGENCEEEANIFAVKNIVDSEKYSKLKKKYSATLLRKYSEEMWVHVWILAGMLSHDKVMNRQTANKRRVNVK